MNCPKCNVEMEVELQPTLREDTFIKKMSCKHQGCMAGRIFEFVKLASKAPEEQIATSRLFQNGGLLQCTQCNKRVMLLHLTTDNVYVCEECLTDNAEKEAVRLHMQSILCE